MSPILLVDTRERDLAQILGATATVAQLDIGDALIRDEPEESGRIAFAFERKSLSDLAASIKDGRYKEQKARLLANVPAGRITYILELEGNTWDDAAPEKRGISISVFKGAYINTMYRDGIHVVFTKNVVETAMWITDVFQKYSADPAKFDGGSSEPYVANLCLKTRRAANLTPQLCYIAQLSQIPGVSRKIAEAIVQVYPTMHDLVLADAKDLQEIPMVGKKKAAVIFQYLKGEGGSS